MSWLTQRVLFGTVFFAFLLGFSGIGRRAFAAELPTLETWESVLLEIENPQFKELSFEKWNSLQLMAEYCPYHTRIVDVPVSILSRNSLRDEWSNALGIVQAALTKGAVLSQSSA